MECFGSRRFGLSRLSSLSLSQQYDELERAGSLMRQASIKPRGRMFDIVGDKPEDEQEDDEVGGGSEEEAKQFGMSRRLYGPEAQV